MRKIKEITAKKENFRIEKNIIRRDPVQPEPIGTIVLIPFKIIGYRPDCDGSLMAQIAEVNLDLKETGWEENAIGLYPNSGFVVTEKELKELKELSNNAAALDRDTTPG